jgi:hypothetical protein
MRDDLLRELLYPAESVDRRNLENDEQFLFLTLPKRPMTTRPAGLPSISTSKNTLSVTFGSLAASLLAKDVQRSREESRADEIRAEHFILLVADGQ